ncbi:tetratricopeptide repeat protein [Endomicrobium proavitum]|uniref:Uncharacterized protein n=1 Tax=Endomicrobium proavitum TaxID=1408281 RepID=A0A0G3WGX0_9BACT|nr:tetratricopeptide repeat protein [Endomicrobium proavitum]AKL97568.1 exported protein of unknown function [Endomicrobium proavitum]
MQNTYNKITILLIITLLLSAQFASAASGRRKHFLSHGPSVSAFGAGETLFSAYRDPSVIQYNPSVMSYFDDNALTLSRYNLYEGSSYNSGSIVFGLGKRYFLGVSAANLSSGDIELRETIYSDEKIASINTWNFLVSFSGFLDFLGLSYGANVKYLYYDLYLNKAGTYMFDAGLSKYFRGPEIFKNTSRIKLGLAAQNFFHGELKADKEADEIPAIYRLSAAISLPVYYRFSTQDILSLYSDIKYEDEFADFSAGVSYSFADKYALRAGYYPQHITFGFGVDFYAFTVDYAGDFSEIDLIHRLGLTYRWANKKDYELMKEAEEALVKEKLGLKEAEQKFKTAKKLYGKGEYLRATDMLADIIVSYPNFESPLHFYKNINESMNETAYSNDELDFGKLTYARGYCAYYASNYQEALNEWNKFIHFTDGTEEVFEYKNKIDDAIKLQQLQAREAELDAKASEIFNAGVANFNAARYVQCIKIMENLQKFVTDNNFSKTVEYYGKAKECINKSVAELAKSLKKKEPVPVSEVKEEKPDIDESSADKKYNEGLILYAQGKYLEAERAWELTLRLNPNHQKAKVALSKIRNNE